MSAPHRTHERVGDHLLPLGLVLLGFALRVFALDRRSLWVDEAFSWWLTGHSPREIVRLTVQLDQHPPLYYLTLHLWRLFFGDSVWAMRALSAYAAVLTLPFVYVIGRRVFSRRGAYLLLLLLTVSPFHVRYAQEVRMYTWLFLWIAAAWVGVGPLFSPSRKVTTGSGLALAGALWTHNMAWVFPVSVLPGLLVTVRARMAHLRSWGIALLLWLPWLPALIHQARGVMARFWIPYPTWDTWLGTWQALTAACFPASRGWTLWAVVFAVLAWAGGRHLRGPRPRLWLSFLLLPMLVEWGVSMYRPLYSTRTLIWLLLPFLLLLTAFFLASSFRPLRLLLLGIFLGLQMTALVHFYPACERESWASAVAYVAHHAQPGDGVVFNAGWTRWAFDYYARGYALDIEEYPVPGPPERVGQLEPLTRPEDMASLRAFLQRHPRVWLVYSHEWYTDPERLTRRTLEVWGEPVESWEGRGIRVFLYRAGGKMSSAGKGQTSPDTGSSDFIGISPARSLIPNSYIPLRDF
ncbi:MAG: hypothetical protein GXO55_02205 [Chloroflexi bacterium]|nr:hypothetical protein [Chloroflexota bacterium]